MPMFFRNARAVRLMLIAIAVSASGCDFKPWQVPELSRRSKSEPVFQAMDRADGIADPVRRCIDYPSPPHLPWPKAMVEALCRDAFAPVPNADVVKAMIDDGDWNGLRAHYDGFLARHRSGQDPEKLLYRSFPARGWNSEDEADRYTRRWLRSQPQDPYANTLRAMHLVRRAWAARGNGFASEVSEQDALKMVSLATQASVLLVRAIDAEPHLMPAYKTLIEAYILGGQPQMMRQGLEAASRRSPANYYVRAEAANYLRLIWGGTRAELDSLAKDAEQHLDRNPRLGMLLAKNTAQLGQARSRGNRHGRALAAARETLETGPDYATLHLAADASERVGYEAETIIYLSQLIRFNRGPADELSRRGWLWEYNGFHARALRDYRAVQAIDPRNAKATQRIAAIELKAAAAQPGH